MRILFWAAFIIISVLLIVCCFLAEGAEQILENLAIRAIIGEASGEGYSGMLTSIPIEALYQRVWH